MPQPFIAETSDCYYISLDNQASFKCLRKYAETAADSGPTEDERYLIALCEFILGTDEE